MRAATRAAGPALALALALLPGGCSTPTPPADAAPEAGAPSEAVSGRVRALLEAEHRRIAAAVGDEDLASRDLAVRRAAVRALARIGGEVVRPRLLRALADEDDDVAAWAAYGLGFVCAPGQGAPGQGSAPGQTSAAETVAALVAHALARPDRGAAAGPAGSAAAGASPSDTASAAATASGSPAGGAVRGRLDPLLASARAIGRCATDASEETLVAWLGGSRARAAAAAYGLGDLAMARKKLREETLVALLGAAAGNASSRPLGDALFAVGRLDTVPPSVVERIREVATARLDDRGTSRIFAVRALGRAGAEGAAPLVRVVAGADEFTAAERGEAARTLARLGPPGKRALADAAAAMAPSADPLALAGLVGEELGVLLAVLDALDGEKPTGAADKALRTMAALPVPAGAPAPLLRRVAHLRCAAAKAVVGADWKDPLLVACDPDTGTDPGAATDAGAATGTAGVSEAIGLRAQVAVLGRDKLVGERLAAWRVFLGSTHNRVRQAALELLEAHGEVPDAPALLAEALAATDEGVVSVAAEVITKQPQRASKATPRKKDRKDKDKDKKDDAEAPTVVGEPTPAITAAIARLLGRPAGELDAELLSSAIDAAGALGMKDAAAPLETLCKSSWPALRAHAAKALDALGGGKAGRTCEAPAAGGELPAELATLLPPAPVRLVFETDAGEVSITLDPEMAPVTATRIVELARSGYYDGILVHRVVPGFVTQFGAPHGDGYGGPAGKPALRCETSPLPFAALDVGVALAGRDTGSSQLFVMHARHPHLDGAYAWVGTAAGPWAAFVDGDRIQRVKVVP